MSNLKFRLIRKEGKDYLSELAVLVSNSDISESVSIAIERARRLCNLISFKCRKGIITIYRGFLVTYIDGRTTVRGESPFIVWSDNQLELTTDEINDIETDPKNSMYQHFSRSFVALLVYMDHATVIRELYQILEENKPILQHLAKYTYLRHALSHGERLNNHTLSKIRQEFGQNSFVFKNGILDYDSPVNIRTLEVEAWKLMTEMLKEYSKI